MKIYNAIVTILYVRMYIRFFPVVLCGHGSILMKQLVLCAFVCDQSCECWEIVTYACEKLGVRSMAFPSRSVISGSIHCRHM